MQIFEKPYCIYIFFFEWKTKSKQTHEVFENTRYGKRALAGLGANWHLESADRHLGSANQHS